MLYNIAYVFQKWKNIAIRNCWISARGAIILHPFGASAERSKACMPKGCNFIAPQALIQHCYLIILYFIPELYRAIFDTSANRSETHALKGCIKNFSIVKLYNKVLIINNVCTKCCVIWRLKSMLFEIFSSLCRLLRMSRSIRKKMSKRCSF